jgi:hypothetical protein
MEPPEELLKQWANLSDDERSEMFEQVLDGQVRQPLIDGSPSELDLTVYVRHVIMRALEAKGCGGHTVGPALVRSSWDCSGRCTAKKFKLSCRSAIKRITMKKRTADGALAAPHRAVPACSVPSA